MYEKRVYIRVPVGIEGSYQPITRLAAPRLGMTRDISLGGARFASTERLEPGGKISLTLSLPKQGEVIFTGIVVWSRMTEQDGGQVGYESGFCWKDVDAHAQARLNSFLTDYTRSDTETVIVSRVQPSQFISWPRAVAFGLAATLMAGMVAAVGLRIFALQSENQFLKDAVRSYQDQIHHLTRYSR